MIYSSIIKIMHPMLVGNFLLTSDFFIINRDGVCEDLSNFVVFP